MTTKKKAAKWKRRSRAGGKAESQAKRQDTATTAVPDRPGKLAGISLEDSVGLIKLVRAGVKYTEVESFRETAGLDRAEVSELLNIPTRTLSRRKEAGKLKQDESERLVRFARIYDQAVRLFEGNTSRAARWLHSEIRALGGQTPLEYMQTEPGAREVEALIGRIEHGVFS